MLNSETCGQTSKPSPVTTIPQPLGLAPYHITAEGADRRMADKHLQPHGQG